MASTRPNLLQALLARQKEGATGVFEVRSGDAATFLYVARGKPVFAEDGTLGETLGRLLVREHVLTEEQYIAVIRRMTEALIGNEQMRFGEVVIELGYMTPAQVHDALAMQVRQKVIRCLQWEDPEYVFEGSPEELEGLGRFPLSIEPLMLVAARRFSEQRTEAVLRPGETLYPRLVGDGADLAELFDLRGSELRFVEGIDGRRTTGDVLASGADVDAAAVVAALVLCGRAELSAEPLEVAATPSIRPSIPPARPEVPQVDPAAALARERAAKAIARLKLVRVSRPAPTPSGRPVAAATSARPAAPSDPREARLLAEDAFQRGVAFVRQDRIDRAAPELKRAHELMPAAGEYHVYALWADLQVDADQGTEAQRHELRRLATAAVRHDPNFAFGFYVLGQLAMHDGDNTFALKAFRHAAKLDPGEVDAARHARLLAMRTGR